MLNNVASAGTGCSHSFPFPLVVVTVVALCWLIKRPRQLAQTVKLLNAHGGKRAGKRHSEWGNNGKENQKKRQQQRRGRANGCSPNYNLITRTENFSFPTRQKAVAMAAPRRLRLSQAWTTKRTHCQRERKERQREREGDGKMLCDGTLSWQLIWQIAV